MLRKSLVWFMFLKKEQWKTKSIRRIFFQKSSSIKANLSFNIELHRDRMQFAALFVKSITQPTCPYLNTIRLKEIYRLEELGTIIEK